MAALRFVMVGGFLGAGKTTAIAALARRYVAAGRRVGIVTNDQAQNLVDTLSLRSQGFAVAEVPGACFCCKFDELVDRVGSLSESQRPDVILTEPVGSCTDLVATVVQPLRDLYADRFEIAPFAVLFKPSHGLRILRAGGSGDGKGGAAAPSGFSPKAEYIFLKQLEEADAIVVNRADELSPADRAELERLVAARFPGRPLLTMSARTGEGFDAFAGFLERRGAYGRRILQIDYDTYAEGEAEMGWLNSSAVVAAPAGAPGFDLDALLSDVVRGVGRAAVGAGQEPGHIKVIGLCEGAFGVANQVSGATGAETSLPSHAQPREAELVVNARSAGDPDVLQEIVRDVLESEATRRGLVLEHRGVQCFRPGRPQPTHRYAEAVG